jgi:hypothetical protein
MWTCVYVCVCGGGGSVGRKMVSCGTCGGLHLTLVSMCVQLCCRLRVKSPVSQRCWPNISNLKRAVKSREDTLFDWGTAQSEGQQLPCLEVCRSITTECAVSSVAVAKQRGIHRLHQPKRSLTLKLCSVLCPPVFIDCVPRHETEYWRHFDFRSAWQ